MSNVKNDSTVERLKHQLKRLTLEQTRDLTVLQAYQRKNIPEHTDFVRRARRETRFRAERIQNLKEQIKARTRQNKST